MSRKAKTDKRRARRVATASSTLDTTAHPRPIREPNEPPPYITIIQDPTLTA